MHDVLEYQCAAGVEAGVDLDMDFSHSHNFAIAFIFHANMAEITMCERLVSRWRGTKLQSQLPNSGNAP